MTKEEKIAELKDLKLYVRDTFMKRTADGYANALDSAIKALEQEPKTGHWIKSDIGGAKVCSVCQAHMGLSNFKYCPNCGAKMKGEA